MNKRNIGSSLLLPLAGLLAACSADTVTMGEDGVSTSLPLASACRENTTFPGSQLVQSPEDLERLEGCRAIEGHLIIEGPNVGSLRALSELESVGGVLSINTIVGMGVNEPTLPSLEGLESLESVGDLVLQGILAEDVDPLSKLHTVTSGSIRVSASPNLKSLDGLGQVQDIRALSIDTPALEALPGLDFADDVAGLHLRGERLSQLPPFEATSIESLTIENTALTNLDAFSATTDALWVRISDNEELESIDGLGSLRTLEGVEIGNNPNLTQLPEFSQLVTLDRLIVTDNQRLVALPAFPQLGNSLTVPFTDELTWPEPRADEIIISRNAALESVSFPPGWRGGLALIIDGNAALTQIAFTEQLNFDRLSITNNAALGAVSLGELDAVDVLEVRNNPELDPTVFGAVRTFAAIIEQNAAP